MSDEPLAIRVRLLRPNAILPARATSGSSGSDLYACLESGALEVGPDPVRVPTGIAIEAPNGYDVQIRPRSGLAACGIIGTVGTIDADYRGELFVTLYTVGSRGPHAVRNGDRIAQLVVARLVHVTWQEVESLAPSGRGTGGHGSTGH